MAPRRSTGVMPLHDGLSNSPAMAHSARITSTSWSCGGAGDLAVFDMQPTSDSYGFQEPAVVGDQ